MRVKSFSEIKETYKDFVIVLSFASNREDVINMILDIDRQYDLYIPDMPVAGEDEYFDKNFYNQHYFEIIEAYDRLEDLKSKNLFSSIIWYKLTGRMKYLMQYTSSKEEMYSFISKKPFSQSIKVKFLDAIPIKAPFNFTAQGKSHKK